MKKLLFVLVFTPALFSAQPVLLPHIGLTAPPQLTDPICPIPVYTGEMDTSGYDEGNSVPDFTLYKTNGDSVRLSEVLTAGKPVLLVAGNYTCPVFRQKIPVLNNITNYYAGLLQVYIVYGVEAHPIVDPSPYSGTLWVTAENNSEGVLYEQPDTYGDRIEMIDSLLANYTVVPEILVDGPCNEWWSAFGPAPNNAYLIGTNGIIQAKQGWFNRNPDNMWCEIDSLLGTNSGNCISAGNNGTFSYTLIPGDSIASGAPGDVLAVHGLLKNLSATDNVEIMLSKQFVNVPADWSTALCADICYAPTVISTNVTISPGDSLNFKLYFYTGLTPDSGVVRVRFKNLNIPTNTIFQKHYGFTSNPTGITKSEKSVLNIFPNPVNEKFIIRSDIEFAGDEYLIYDCIGKMVLKDKLIFPTTEISMTKEPSGIYYLITSGGLSAKIIKN
jgi:hypothetical protein